MKYRLIIGIRYLETMYEYERREDEQLKLKIRIDLLRQGLVDITELEEKQKLEYTLSYANLCM